MGNVEQRTKQFREVPSAEQKVITFETAKTYIRIAREMGNTAVYTSGVFDVLHGGHIDFLLAARSEGDYLFVGLESDQTTRLNKGPNRPCNTMEERLKVLSQLMCVDFVFPYTDVVSYSDIDAFAQRYQLLNPTRIAASSFDPALQIKNDMAQAIDSELIVISGVKSVSSSQIINLTQ